jgi:hypothetical protein
MFFRGVKNPMQLIVAAHTSRWMYGCMEGVMEDGWTDRQERDR